MPPKKNAKKGKRVDDEDFWAEKEAKIVDPLAAAESEEEDVPQPAKGGKKGAKKSAFELLQELEGGAVAEGDDFSPTANAPAAPEVANMDDEWPEEDIKPKKGKKKGGKKSKQADLDDDDDMDGSATPAVEEVPTPAAPEVANIDDEWPEEDVKPKKGKKKGGKKSKSADLEDDDMDVATPEVETVAAPAATPAAEEVEAAPSPAAPGTPAEPADGEEEGGIKILSKKEKERLKKEKEKAKKKAQAAAKKGNAPAALTETPAPQEPAPQDDQNDAGADDAEETGAGASDKKKKKKKKAATVEEKKEEPAGKPKKVNARVAALQAALAEQKALEEAARRQAEEDERLRLEEEAKIAEEERKVEEEKQRRKDKERAKREQLRKDGKLLTAKQKREQQMAALRKEQLLASGVVIEGLQNQDVEKPKKVVYGNKKKQQPKKAEPSPAPTPVAAPEPEKKDTAAAGSDDDWDKSDDEKVEELTQAVEKTQIQDSDDDWDKSSDEEEEPVKPAATPAKAAPGANGKAPASTNGKIAAAAKPTGKPAAKAAEESSSEEESDSEDDSEDDSDDSSDDSDDDSDDSDDSSEPERQTEAQKKAQAEKEQRIQEAAARRAQRHQEALAARSKDDLRSPICCILGHVDTGKTKLLDKIRQTNVQEGEAGGITQQIGATYFPLSAIKEKTQVVNKDNSFDFKVPGLLIIDTPGHESFTNLRSRGSSLCNIAILVVDITHGLEPQTLESIRLLKERKTPFIVALNKIDRCYGWKEIPNGSFRDTFAQQSAGTKREFETRLQATKLAFAEQGFNSELYYENKDLGRTVSLVPTSAITGEGVPDMIMLLIQLTQQRMTERLMYISELECTVLEVKVIEGLGTTIDVILSNGVMREGDRIVVCGMDGAIATNVRALLTPQPLRELRVKSQYVHHKEVKAALGIKIAAPGLEKAVAGCRLFVVGPDDDEDEIKLEAEKDFKSMEEYIDKDKRGVYVQASTLGSLEALLEFLRSSKIPVANISIGPVYRKDIVKASAQLEKNPEYAVVLCFDVPVDKDAKAMAEELNVKVFEAQIIYHLFDAFTAYMNEVVEARKRDAAPNAVWPVRLKTLRAFAKRDPIVLGVDIIEGSLRVGTPICVVKLNKETGKKDIIPLGKITSIEINHVTKDVVKKAQIGAGAAIKIEHAVYQSSKAFGRHFDEKDELISHISRQSIDVLKTNFRKEADLSDWALIKQLKTRLDIA